MKETIKGERLKLKTGKLILKYDEYIPKKLGRKLVVFIITAAMLILFFVLSKLMNIGADKLEIVCKWTVISATAYTGGNATIASISQIVKV